MSHFKFKNLLYLLLLICISCGYQKPQKDKYPEILEFSETVLNPEKLNLKFLNNKNEDIKAIFIKKNKCIIISAVREFNYEFHSDSIVISEYTSFKNCTKYYYNKDQSIGNETNKLLNYINLFNLKMIDDVIYSTNHKFSPPNYKPQLIPSNYWENREDSSETYNITSSYNTENILHPFDSIVVGNTTQCGGGRLGGPMTCPIMLDYFNISNQDKTIYFKEKRTGNTVFNKFKILNIFGKDCLLYLPRVYNTNTCLFIIDE